MHGQKDQLCIGGIARIDCGLDPALDPVARSGIIRSPVPITSDQ
jgi:hypothetical protein